MPKFLVETFMIALAIAVLILVFTSSMTLCERAMDNPQAFFAGRVH